MSRNREVWVLRIEPLEAALREGRPPVWEHQLDLNADLTAQYREFVGGSIEIAAELDNGDFVIVNENPHPRYAAKDPRFLYGFRFARVPFVICGPAFIVGRDTRAGNPTSANTPQAAVMLTTEFLKVFPKVA